MRLRLIAVLAFSTAVLLAASVHFVVGPTALDAGTQLVVSGKIAGLGEGDVTILVTADGLASVECSNPAGNVAPGQDTAVSVSGFQVYPSPKNGNLVFSVSTVAPSIPSSACVASSGKQWSAAATDVAFSGGVITVSQGGVIVLQQEL